MGEGVCFDGVDEIKNLISASVKEHGSEFLASYTSDKSVAELKTCKGKSRLRGINKCVLSDSW